MNGKVLVVCASRGRPKELRNMIKSVGATSTKAEVAVYLDEDDSSYDGIPNHDSIFRGPRIGPCRAMNEVVESKPGYSAYGWGVDDSLFVTEGWDEWILEGSDRVMALCPYTINGAPKRMDFPFLTGKWVERAGCFVPYEVEHFYWDIALQIVAEQVGIDFATEDEFSIQHLGIMPEQKNPKEHKDSDYGRRIVNSHADARTTCRWLALERQDMVARLTA